MFHRVLILADDSKFVILSIPKSTFRRHAFCMKSYWRSLFMNEINFLNYKSFMVLDIRNSIVSHFPVSASGPVDKSGISHFIIQNSIRMLSLTPLPIVGGGECVKGSHGSHQFQCQFLPLFAPLESPTLMWISVVVGHSENKDLKVDNQITNLYYLPKAHLTLGHPVMYAYLVLL